MKRISPQLELEICKYYINGALAREIAEHFKISHMTVHRVVNKHNVKRAPFDFNKVL